MLKNLHWACCISIALAVGGCLQVPGAAQAQTAPGPSLFPIPLRTDVPRLQAKQQKKMDRDLLEISIPRLQALYAQHRYTVEQVTRWSLDRIARYNGVYRSMQTVDVEAALATAREQDAHKRGAHGALWGVPIVIKANTAVKGEPNTDGWAGFALPGHTFV